MLGRLADDVGPQEGWTWARRPSSSPVTGAGRRGGGLWGVLPGKGGSGAGRGNRFPVSQGTTAVTTEGRGGGKLGPTLH